MQLEIPFNPLNRNEKLAQSSPETVSEALIEELQDVKDWIVKQQEDGWLVAVVHLSGDLLHSAHVQYLNTIHAKLRKELGRPFKLVVGVEADQRTEARKNKTNVYNQEERKLIFENLKPVDLAYIQFEHLDEQTNDKRPAGIIQFLQPNVLVSHSEHIPPEEVEQVQARMKAQWGDLVVVEFWDQEKYWLIDARVIRERSTTNTIKQILQLYKDHPKYQ